MLAKILLTLLLFTTTLGWTDPILIAIAGGTGSGKTTIANTLKHAFENNTIIITQDNYYKDLSHLPLSQRTKINFDHPDALDFALLEKHLLALKQNQPIDQPTYDFSTHTRKNCLNHITSKEVIIVEGILLLAIPKIRNLFNIKIYIDTDPDIRLLRRIERDIKDRGRSFENIRDQYLATVHPMHVQLVEPSKRFADFIIPQGGKNQIAINIIISMIKEHLSCSQF